MSGIGVDADEDVGRVRSLAVAVQPFIWAGIGRRYPWALFGLEEQAKVVWGVSAVVLLLFGYPIACFLEATAARRSAVRRFAIILLLFCPALTAGLDILSSRHFAQFGYRSAGPLVALEGLVLVALAFWIRSPRLPGTGIALAAVAVCAHRLAAVALFPLDERRSDMFSILARAVDVWRSGGTPHVEYLPGTWLALVPSFYFGLDPRILGSVILLGIGLALARSLRRGVRGPSSEPASVTEVLAMLVLLNPYHAFRHDLYFDAFLALTVAIFYLGARGRGTKRSLLIVAMLVGLAVATRQWAWVYGPFALLAAASSVALPRPDRTPGSTRGERPWGALLAALGLAGVVCAIAAAIVFFAIIRDPAALRYAGFAYAGETFSEICLGAAGLAAGLGLVRFLVPLQATLCVAGFGKSLLAALRGRARPRSVLATGWFVWGGFILLNPFLENYFYLSLGFAAAGLAVGASRDSGANYQ